MRRKLGLLIFGLFVLALLFSNVSAAGCEAQGGQICSSMTPTETCDGTWISATDTGICCKGQCTIPNDNVCEDTDGGKQYFEKGTVTVTAKNPVNIDLTDRCEGDYLYEFYCTDLKDTWEKYSGIQGDKDVKFQCPNGCEDGACISEEKPDLIITDATNIPENVKLGEKVSPIIHYKNIGTESVTGFYIYGEVCGNKGWGLGPDSGVTILPEEERTYHWSAWECSAGEQQAYFKIDSDNRVDESNENNNEFTKTFYVGDAVTPPPVSVGKDILLVVDDDSPPSDIVSIADLGGWLHDNKDFEMPTANLNSEVKKADTHELVTVFVYNKKFLIIVGKDSPASDTTLANDIKQHLEDEGHEVCPIIKSNDLTSDDLKASLCEEPELEPMTPENPYYSAGTDFDGVSCGYKVKCSGGWWKESCDKEFVGTYYCRAGDTCFDDGEPADSYCTGVVQWWGAYLNCGVGGQRRGICKDATAPQISNIQKDVSVTKATVTWNTNEPARSYIIELKEEDTGAIQTFNLPVQYFTEHNTVLTNLGPETTYLFKIKALDAAENSRQVTNGFVTLKEGEEGKCIDDDWADDIYVRGTVTDKFGETHLDWCYVGYIVEKHHIVPYPHFEWQYAESCPANSNNNPYHVLDNPTGSKENICKVIQVECRDNEWYRGFTTYCPYGCEDGACIPGADTEPPELIYEYIYKYDEIVGKAYNTPTEPNIKTEFSNKFDLRDNGLALFAKTDELAYYYVVATELEEEKGEPVDLSKYGTNGLEALNTFLEEHKIKDGFYIFSDGTLSKKHAYDISLLTDDKNWVIISYGIDASENKGELLVSVLYLKEEEEGETCTDSDGGRKIYVKGYTEGTTKVGDYWGKSWDFCQSDTQLIEYSCRDNHDYMSAFDCTYGCKDGACLAEEEVEPCLPDLEITKDDIMASKNYVLIGEPVELKIRGHNRACATNDKFLMKVGDTATIGGKTVILKNVGSATTNTPIIIEVDGVTETVTGTETVNGLRIRVIETSYNKDPYKRTATLEIRFYDSVNVWLFTGEQVRLPVGADFKVVKLLTVSSDALAVQIDVDGIVETVTGTETVNGVEIGIKNTYYNADINKRSAQIGIGLPNWHIANIQGDSIVSSPRTEPIVSYPEKDAFGRYTITKDEPIPAYGTSYFTKTWMFPEIDRNYTLTIKADPDNIIKESDETNNEAKIMIPVVTKEVDCNADFTLKRDERAVIKGRGTNAIKIDSVHASDVFVRMLTDVTGKISGYEVKGINIGESKSFRDGKYTLQLKSISNGVATLRFTKCPSATYLGAKLPGLSGFGAGLLTGLSWFQFF